MLMMILLPRTKRSRKLRHHEVPDTSRATRAGCFINQIRYGFSFFYHIVILVNTGIWLPDPRMREDDKSGMVIIDEGSFAVYEQMR